MKTYVSRVLPLSILLTLGLTHQLARGEEKTRAERETTTPAIEHEELAQSRHTAVIGGSKIPYTAIVGRLQLRNAEGEARASMYYYSYVRDGVADIGRRPLTFAFNGGPGSSSAWLHLGLMGPKRVPIPDDATLPSPPYKLVANEQSLLDITDIVMVDPISTGISRHVKGVDAGQFHGYDEDIQSVGDFIERFVTLNNRWKSPKFLLGESYGTTRAAGLSGYLQSRHGMYLNGIAMISSVLNFQTIRFGNGNDLPYVLFLPSYTATAWHHRRLDNSLQQDLRKTLTEVEKFATEQYSVALFKGARLSAAERATITEQLSRFTGLSTTFIEQCNLRVSMSRFSKELLRDRRRTIGRLDSRFQGIDRDAAGAAYEYDPSNAAILGPYTALLNDYLRNDLKYELKQRYHIFGSVRPWNYDNFTNRYVDASETLRSAMSENPSLKVFVASGYMDLATPYFASDFTYHQLRLEPELHKNITMAYYEAGHMMYIHGPSLIKLKDDLTSFYQAAVEP